MLAADSKNYRAEVNLCGPLKLVDDEGLEALSLKTTSALVGIVQCNLLKDW